MRVKCLAQEHNTMTRPGIEPGRLDPESSALTTTRQPHLTQCHCIAYLIISVTVVYQSIFYLQSDWHDVEVKTKCKADRTAKKGNFIAQYFG